MEEGGETSFSNSQWLDEKLQSQGSPSECARNKVFVKARKGDALLFFDLLPVSYSWHNSQDGELAHSVVSLKLAR